MTNTDGMEGVDGDGESEGKDEQERKREHELGVLEEGGMGGMALPPSKLLSSMVYAAEAANIDSGAHRAWGAAFCQVDRHVHVARGCCGLVVGVSQDLVAYLATWSCLFSPHCASLPFLFPMPFRRAFRSVPRRALYLHIYALILPTPTCTRTHLYPY
jgi:hypothetical protein